MDAWVVVLIVVLVLAVVAVVTILVRRSRRRSKPTTMGLPDLGALNADAPPRRAERQTPAATDPTTGTPTRAASSENSAHGRSDRA